MTTNEKATRLKDALRQTRYAIIGRGGEISETAGLKDLRGAIFNIPADNAITTVVEENEDLIFGVPDNTTGYAYLAEFGGFSRSLGDGFNTEALGMLVCWTDDWDEVDSLVVPEEIRNLPDYGEGINLEYYNKVDLVDQKYKRCIETFTFDGSEGTGSSSKPTGWRMSGSGERAYFLIKIGDFGEYAIGDVIICDKYETTSPPTTANIGVGIYNSTSSGGICVSFRPENVSEITSTSALVAFLANNPITVKVAHTVPIETDLPVYMNPIFKVAPSSIGIELFPSDGTGIPAKIKFQTYTQ